MARQDYQRLTRARVRRDNLVTRLNTRSSLWLAKDHLLCVDMLGYAERYKRFHLRDIQAFLIVASRRRAIWNWVLGSATGFCLLACGVVLYSGAALGWIIVSLMSTVLFAVPLLVNNVQGPTCDCYIRTAVQTELLSSLSRVRQTRKVLDQLRPLIAAAQGQLSVEEIERKSNEPSALPPMIAARPASSLAPPKPYQSPFHLTLSWLLLADLPLTAADLALAPGTLDALSIVFLLITLGMAIVCLVKQQGTDLSAALRRIPWITLVSTGCFLFVGIAYGILRLASNPDLNMEALSREDPVMMSMALVSTGLWVALGLSGLIGWRKFNEARTGRQTPAPTEATPVV